MSVECGAGVGVDPKFLDSVVTVAGKYVMQFENYLRGSNQLSTLNTWEHLKRGFFDEIENLRKTGSWKEDVVVIEVSSSVNDMNDTNDTNGATKENSGKQSGGRKRHSKKDNVKESVKDTENE